MEAKACRHIEIEVCVMHHMQAPEKWNRMMQNMLQVDREIKCDYSDDYFKPVGKIEVVEQSPVTLRRPEGPLLQGESGKPGEPRGD